MTNVLFLCGKSDSRSQMAEGFARARQLPDVSIASAGVSRGRIDALAVKVMAEVGIDISKQRVTTLQEHRSDLFDIVINLCEHSADEAVLLPGRPEWINWNLSPPEGLEASEDTVLQAFREARDRIRVLIDDFFDKGYFRAFVATRRRTHAILDTISDGIIAYDVDGRIVYFNKAAEDVTGYSSTEAINQECHDVFPGQACGGQCVLCREKDGETGVARQKLDIRTRSGERRFVRAGVNPLSNLEGEPLGGVIAFQDVHRDTEARRTAMAEGQFEGLIGRHESMLSVFQLIRELADTHVPVLIQGESGTGKELVAAAIHAGSERKEKLFVPVNCGALPESLLESELFGHVKGAFTGAVRDKKGRFELADEGTIFLDEIGDIEPAMQVKLLRVLQEGTFERVGSEKTLRVNVRVISATNKNLAEEIDRGQFREDLFYRLNVVPVTLPPLRERKEDIPLLVDFILQKLAGEMGRSAKAVSKAAMNVFLEYHWPGNVRELQNWLQFALVKCRSTIVELEHLPPGRIAAPGVGRQRRRKLSVDAVRMALGNTGGNKVEAARELGVSRATLYRFLDEIGLDTVSP